MNLVYDNSSCCDLISIIIPVYNHAHILERSILSIAKQTYRQLEIIIVNDGSTDNFAAAKQNILARSELDGFNIIFLQQAKAGASVARNYGLSVAKGKYIVFWDADTIARPQMLACLYQILQANQSSSYAYCQFRFGLKKIRSHKFDSDLLKQINYIDTTSLIRRSDLPVGGFDEAIKRFQDWDLYLTMLEQGKVGVFLPKVLFKKTTHHRRGISRWLPKFAYKLFPNFAWVKDYHGAKRIVLEKHGIVC